MEYLDETVRIGKPVEQATYKPIFHLDRSFFKMNNISSLFFSMINMMLRSPHADLP